MTRTYMGPEDFERRNPYILICKECPGEAEYAFPTRAAMEHYRRNSPHGDVIYEGTRKQYARQEMKQ